MKLMTWMNFWRRQRGLSGKRKVSWKLYLLLALTALGILLLAGCGSENASDSNSGQGDSGVLNKQDSVQIAAPAAPLNTRPSVLILHDSAGEWGYIGREHAVLLENLLGHFSAAVTIQPVSTYRAGLLNRYSTTFYIGSTYDEPSYYEESSAPRANYKSFLKDVVNSPGRVVWINHNLWQLAWNWEAKGHFDEFSDRFGFSYSGLVNQGYNRVVYKGRDLHKGVVRFANPGAALQGCLQEADGQYACAPELNKIKIEDDFKVRVHAHAYSSIEAAAGYSPYIVSSGNFWFVGDLPFSYFTAEDRYIAFADLLHDILDISHAESAQALLSIENINPASDVAELEKLFQMLELQNIPFAASVTAAFSGAENALADTGSSNTLQLQPDSAVGKLLQRYADKGLLSVVSNGYTHQWEGGANPHSGITGEDYEFYRVTKNDDLSLNFVGPLTTDGERAYQRLRQAEALLQQSGLKAFAWKPSAYLAAESDYLAAREIYPVTYGRVTYFDHTGPEGRYVGQLFPYLIERDRYGYRVIPENLGGLEPEPAQGYEKISAADLLRRLDQLSVVRDRIASFYFNADQPLAALQEVIDGFHERGYRFTSPCLLGFRCNAQGSRQSGNAEQIRSVLNSRILDAGGPAGNSDTLGLWQAHAGNSQRWIKIQSSGSHAQLLSSASGRCLSLDASLPADGARVLQEICNNQSPLQLWKQFGTEYRNRANGQCLSATNLNQDGAAVVTTPCNNSAAQVWKTSATDAAE